MVRQAVVCGAAGVGRCGRTGAASQDRLPERPVTGLLWGSRWMSPLYVQGCVRKPI
jgi:hypothetical protein